MRQWQDRGVVKDSDEEDSLDLENPLDDEPEEDDDSAGIQQPEGALETRSVCKEDAPDTSSITPSRQRAKPESQPSTLADPRPTLSSEIFHGLFSNHSSEEITSQASREPSTEQHEPDTLEDLFRIPSSPPDRASPSLPPLLAPQASLLSPVSVAQSPTYVSIPSEEKLSVKEGTAPHVAIERGIARNLRHRNPIQVHPYLLEDEAYRRSLRGRGMRPVHVTQELEQDTAPPENITGHQSSQSSQFLLSSSQHQQQQPSPLRGNTPGSKTIDPDAEDESDSLPRVETLMHRARAGEVRVGHKRRKIGRLPRLSEAKPNPSRSLAIDNAPKQSSWTGSVSGIDTMAAEDDTVSNSPSKKYRNPNTRKPFRVPLAEKEASIPTPAASSELSRYRQEHSENASESDSDDIRRPTRTRRPRATRKSPTHPQPAPINISSSPSSESRITESHNEHVRLVQKRIKGVLPASWLRLDRQVNPQGKRPRAFRAEQAQSPEKGSARGVARKVIRTTGLNSGNEMALSATQSSSGEDLEDRAPEVPDALEHENQPVVLPDQEPVIIDDYPDGFGSAIEEDYIDPMLQSLPRARNKTTKRSRKRQTKLDDAFMGSTINLPDAPRLGLDKPSKKDGSRRQTRGNTGAHRKQWVRRKQVPKLSILDAPNISPGSKMPNFVKIARRQASRRPETSRQSPSRKLVSLQTQQDGADVDLVFQDWRKGRIKRQRPFRMARQDHQDSHTGNACSNMDLMRPSSHRDSTTNYQENCPRLEESGKSLKLRSKVLRPLQLTTLPLVSLEESENPLQPIPAAVLNRQSPRRQSHPSRSNYTTNRQGQLEQLLADRDEQHPHQAFHCGLLSTRAHAKGIPTEGSEPLKRFLADSTTEDVSIKESPKVRTASFTAEHQLVSVPRKPRIRKRRPRQIDQAQIEIHRPLDISSEPDLELGNPDSYSATEDTPKIHGLLPYGSTYSTDFGIAPLPAGVCFRSSTFIGSGELFDALTMAKRNLDSLNGRAEIVCENVCFRIGVWSEQVADNIRYCLMRSMGFIPSSAMSYDDRKTQPSTSETSNPSILRSLVKYISKNLSFSDAIDRQLFLSSIAGSLGTCLNHIQERENTQHAARPIVMTRLLFYLLVMATQAFQIGQHPTITEESRSTIGSVVGRIAYELAVRITSPAARDISTFYNPLRLRLIRESGINEADVGVEGIVGLNHCLRTLSTPEITFWRTINSVLVKRVAMDESSVPNLEWLWHEVLAIVPLLEIDIQGLLRPGSRTDPQQARHSDCSTVRELLARTLNMAGSSHHDATLNAYVRAVLGRCHRLIRVWGWARCEPLLSSAYDFFARRGFAGLPHELCNGSAQFLEKLDVDASPHVDASDRSFHIFLKMLATGLMEMRNVYTDKKIRNIACRFVPNHGRSYQKDEGIRQVDLEALRNHHDLLCVLHYAGPTSMKPSLTPLRNLVDFKSSHTEACKLNIRAWSNLIRHHLSESGRFEGIEGFVSWIEDMMSGCIYQYRLARTEAEHAAENARGFFSWDVLDATVTKNQQAVEGLMEIILQNFSALIRNSKNHEAASKLFERSPRALVFNQFCQNHCLLSSRTLVASLESYDAYLLIIEKQRPPIVGSYDNDDSQDYGDLDFDEIDDSSVGADTKSDCLETVVNELFEFLKVILNCSAKVDDECMSRLIKTCARAISTLVKRGRGDWSYYLDMNGLQPSQHFQDNEQVRKFMPSFYASIIDFNHSAFQREPLDFLNAWVSSLVERDAMLKHQHQLTSAILNVGGDHDLLQNLPFARDSLSEKYTITSDELRHRRASLISSMLFNVRQLWDSSTSQSSGQGSHQSRTICTTLLKTLMSTMKRNYEEMQPGSSTRSTYIDFVQLIVQLLQQHTTPILPIDKFFTDSTAFPLPVTDPLYVTGRLRSYENGRGLVDKNSQKRLIIFIQNIAERAAAEQHHIYFTEQLVKSVEGSRRQSSAVQPNLRLLLMGTVFPAYIQTSGEKKLGFLLTLPVLDATQKVLGNAINVTNLGDMVDVGHLLETISVILESALSAVRSRVLLDEASSGQSGIRDSGFVRTLTYLYRTAASTIPIVDFVLRSQQCRCLHSGARRAWWMICNMSTIADSLYSQLMGQEPRNGTAAIPHIDDIISVEEQDPQNFWRHKQDVTGLAPTLDRTILDFARAELKRILHAKYSESVAASEGRRYWINREVEIFPNMGILEEEHESLMVAVKILRTTIDSTGMPRARRTLSRHDDADATGAAPSEFLKDLLV